MSELNRRSHPAFYGQLSGFTRSAIRAAVQAVGDQSEIAQTATDLERTLAAQRGQRAIRIIRTLMALNRDAMPQQQ
jgi:hypothetical protein